MAIVTTLLKIAGSLVLILLGIALAPGEEEASKPSPGPDPANSPGRSGKRLIRLGRSGGLRSRERSEELTAKCYAATET